MTRRSLKNEIAMNSIKQYSKCLRLEVENMASLRKEFPKNTQQQSFQPSIVQGFDNAKNFGSSKIDEVFVDKGSSIIYNDEKRSITRMLVYLSHDQIIPSENLKGLYLAHLKCYSVLNKSIFILFMENWEIIEQSIMKNDLNIIPNKHLKSGHLKRTAILLIQAMKLMRVRIEEK